MKTKITPVIVRCQRQAAQVDRLVQYCYDLDGTRITVLDAGEDLPYPKCNDAALHQAAANFKGKPFFWMEPDSIPLKPGWLQILSDEYRRGGKEFMLSSDSNPPYDIIGGIGVYGPNTHWFIPKTFEKNAWDFWMIHHAKDVTHRTPLIQHSYGIYFRGKADPHRFPKDQALIREDALIFHRDKFQDLIDPSTEVVDPERKEKVFRHGGDIGDVIAAMPIFRHMGGGKLVLFHDPDAPEGLRGRESLEGARFEAIRPLLEVQPYITSVEWGAGVDATNFRTIARPKFESLTERQARHVGQWPISLSPWLTVPEPVEQHKRVVCARSPRYHNSIQFPWKELSDTYGDRLLFVGLPAEHEAFEKLLGRRVEHAKTENFLDIARIMAGSPQVVCNQSAPLWVALGLGVKIICEANPDFPNSQLPRPGSFWAYTEADMATLRRAFAAAKQRAS